MTELVAAALQLLAVVGLSLTVLTIWVVGIGRVREAVRTARTRLGEITPSVAILALVLVGNRFARDYGPDVSWLVGLNITGYIYTVEGSAISHLQSVASPPVVAYFAAAYVVGYVLLLVFPFIAYFAADGTLSFRRMAAAYVLNYGIGVACYLLFISYGPRNVIPGQVDGLLYSTYPLAQLLTTQVNANTNVFPSLHTSLSVSVAILAWQTRETYPRWAYVAIPLAASVVVSTMFLGIHWATDVVAGVVVGAVSVRYACRLGCRVAEWRPLTRVLAR